MIVKKVFNNNVVLVVNDTSTEEIVMGKGIGFNKFPGDVIDSELVEKQFIFQGQDDVNRFYQMVGRIPLHDVELASEIVEMGKQDLLVPLSDCILITLSDHISHMLERVKRGLFFNSPLQWEIKHIYPKEYAFGEKAVEFLKDKTGLEIPISEAAFISLHFANAHLEMKGMEETMLLTKIIDQILDVVKYHYSIELDGKSYDFSRFITHLRYFVKRQLKNEENKVDSSFLSLIKLQYPYDFKCGEKIKKFLETTYRWEISEDELLYLTIHLNRLNRHRIVTG
ncbi:BglG family transcription antiterminator LicT [Peribacillus loiseleuriae]|uniref:BglG family transcription antiterminator LicT n=1 Tax=Peribacillus loiseleuriae TaxID=1679170 RepID=UPI000AC7608F|nr:PRD domain-containing protein [Peribacillus loiseleuriae]